MSDVSTGVDEMLPPPRLAALGLQHVLVMYAGAVAVPLILAGAAGLPPDQRAFLISADILACGLATLVQAFGFPGVGIRLPVMMGVTFASVAPMLALINAAKEAGGAPASVLTVIYGSVISAGIFAVLVAPLMSRLITLFPPVVTGSIILVIGLSLMRIGVGWAEGPLKVFDVATKSMIDNPDRDALGGFAMSLLVLLVILAVTKYGKGFVANISVLLGIVVGAIVAALLGKMSFGAVGSAAYFGLVTPFQFGWPDFQIVPIVTMCVVMIVVMIESTGMFLALGDMTGKKLDAADITRGLRADGVGTIIGGLFNAFPYTSFSQNVGLVGVTGIRSRFVAVAGGVILILLSLLPKLAAIVAAVPVEVLGGAGIVMFGMVAATGVRILGGVDFRNNRNNLFIVAIGVGAGLIPLIAPTFFKNFPVGLKPILDSGIILTTIVAVILNAYYNGLGSQAAVEGQLAEAARAADH
ncbi:nucleobase:cation symporter-2 family protein [Methylocapsa sp. S129]|uniref:nucleobase:cation symporter-2 family protein n=1 Tax=Methylocapsa sp. S129 TaxID=1641869 RepID=UPI00131D4F98|nr:nucleobase:cation symporter-2 family protein [Methylocapsa sp. S129]